MQKVPHKSLVVIVYHWIQKVDKGIKVIQETMLELLSVPVNERWVVQVMIVQD